jgi:phage protein D
MSVPLNPRSVIDIGGKNFEPFERFDSFKDKQLFESVDIDLTTGDASEAIWKVFDVGSRFLDRWKVSDGITALEARVWLGFGDALGTPIFEGLLASAESSDSTTTLRFYDKSYILRRFQKSRYHKDADDIHLMKKIVEEYGLIFDGPKPPIKLDKHKSIIQAAQTDWDFIQERAEEIGVVLYVRGNTVFAREAAKTGDPALQLVFGIDNFILQGSTFRYRAPENQEGTPAKVEVYGRGPGGKRLTGESSHNNRGTHHTQSKRDLAIHTKRHADRRAHAKKELKRAHAFTGNVSIIPAMREMVLDVRATVMVMEQGKLFSNKYLISHASHSFSPGHLESQLDLYRDAKLP